MAAGALERPRSAPGGTEGALAMRNTLPATMWSRLGRERTTALQDLRRTGPLADLSTEGYAMLMGSTLHLYGAAASPPSPPSPSPPTPSSPSSPQAPSLSASGPARFQSTDLADMLRQIQAVFSESENSLDSSTESPAWLSSHAGATGRLGAPAGGGMGTVGSPGFWNSGRTIAEGTDAMSSTANSSILGAAEEFDMPLGGDGNQTFAIHNLMRQLINDGEFGTSLAEEATRMAMLGSAATGQSLSEVEIEALPQVRFESAEMQTCAICLEAYQPGEVLTALRCNHYFHVACLARWLQSSTQCPLCRTTQRVD